MDPIEGMHNTARASEEVTIRLAAKIRGVDFSELQLGVIGAEVWTFIFISC